MTQIKKSIIILSIICIVSFLLSYVFSINVENHYFRINSPWISNDFAFACICGIFASTIILLATEVIKYVQEKKTVEHFTFNQMVIIYGELLNIRRTISEYLQSNDKVPANLMFHTSAVLGNCVNMLRPTDYNPINNYRNKKKAIITAVSTDLVSKLQKLIFDFTFVHTAVLTDQIMFNEERMKNPSIEPTYRNTKRTLNILVKEIDDLSKEVHVSITNLDEACNNRFKWTDIEPQISNIPKTNTSLTLFYAQHENNKS